VTARVQVSDDGQRRIARGAIRGLRRRDFAGRYILPRRPWLVCLALVVSLQVLSRRGCSFVVCVWGGRGVSTLRGRRSRQAFLGQAFSSLRLPLTQPYIMNNSKHALTINQPDNQLKCYNIWGSKLSCGTCAKYHYASVQNYVITCRMLTRANYYDMSLCTPLHACIAQLCTTKNAPVDFRKKVTC
jgi:hypothetical protein